MKVCLAQRLNNSLRTGYQAVRTNSSFRSYKQNRKTKNNNNKKPVRKGASFPFPLLLFNFIHFYFSRTVWVQMVNLYVFLWNFARKIGARPPMPLCCWQLTDRPPDVHWSSLANFHITTAGHFHETSLALKCFVDVIIRNAENSQTGFCPFGVNFGKYDNFY